MSKLMLIDASHPEETRVVVADNDKVQEYDVVTTTKQQVKSNIYLAKITRVEPSLQAAFVDYGAERQGFLPFSEIHPDYYQIPVADKEKIKALMRDETALDDEFDTDISDEKTEDEPQDESPQTIAADMELDGQEDIEDDASADKENEKIETLPDEEQPAAHSHNRYKFLRRYKIQEVIKKNQVVLVQVAKEERGSKGAALTTYISMAGRYCVLMPNTTNAGGISRKISDGESRRRLKSICDTLETPDGMSVIIRTAGIDRSRAEIRRDLDYLKRSWDSIREKVMSSHAPLLVYEEGDIIKRALRDLYKNDIEQVVVEGEDAFKSAKSFMKTLMPSHAVRVKQYTGDIPLYYAYDIEDQLLMMHDPVVPLPSGGYLVINPTEALVSIDINSGRATKERNVEETALKNNVEAAREIARQLRLRDLAGLLVIDFIDMYEFRNRRKVERAMKDALRHDRARIQVGRISPFGLLEMSRQRMRPSVTESNTHSCERCHGSGIVRSTESMAIQLLRTLENEAYDTFFNAMQVVTHPDIAYYVLNNKRMSLTNIEHKFQLHIDIEGDHKQISNSFLITKVNDETEDTITIDERGNVLSGTRKAKQARRVAEKSHSDFTLPFDESNSRKAASHEEDDEEDEGRSRRRRGRRGGRRNRRQQDDADQMQDTSTSETVTDVDVDADQPDQEATPKTTRRSSGRRKLASDGKTDHNTDSADAGDADEKPKRRGRPKKSEAKAETAVENADEKPKRATRRRKTAESDVADSSKEADESTAQTAKPPAKATRKTVKSDDEKASTSASRTSSSRRANGKGAVKDTADTKEKTVAEASSSKEMVTAEADMPPPLEKQRSAKWPKRTGWWNRA